MWFDGVRQPNTLYVASVSRGKDSTAMLRAIQLMGWPLDMIAAVDIWATDDIPAELPPMVAFKDEWDAKCLEQFGMPVTRLSAMRKVCDSETPQERERATPGTSTDRTSTETQKLQTQSETESADSLSGEGHGAGISKSTLYQKLTYEKLFYHVPKRRSKGVHVERERESRAAERIPTNQGELVYEAQNPTYLRTQSKDSQLSTEQSGAPTSSETRSDKYANGQGWATRHSRWCQSRLKGDVLDRAFSAQPQERGAKINIVHYIGIAADEPTRIERHMKDTKKILPLVQIGWDEALCGLEAQYLDMLSPTYDGSTRDGCWFCHNQGVEQLRKLRKEYPELWALLMKWDLDSPVSFHADGHTVHDFDRRFQLEDEGLITADGKKFKWSMLNAELNYRMF